MPIVIINDDERLCYEVEGSKFFYRRFGLRAQADLFKEYAEVSEQRDYSQLAMKTLEACVIGWENILDSTGADIPFDVTLISRLPTTTINALFEKIMAVAPVLARRDVEGELKNSPATSE